MIICMMVIYSFTANQIIAMQHATVLLVDRGKLPITAYYAALHMDPIVGLHRHQCTLMFEYRKFLIWKISTAKNVYSLWKLWLTASESWYHGCPSIVDQVKFVCFCYARDFGVFNCQFDQQKIQTRCGNSIWPICWINVRQIISIRRPLVMYPIR